MDEPALGDICELFGGMSRSSGWSVSRGAYAEDEGRPVRARRGISRLNIDHLERLRLDPGSKAEATPGYIVWGGGECGFGNGNGVCCQSLEQFATSEAMMSASCCALLRKLKLFGGRGMVVAPRFRHSRSRHSPSHLLCFDIFLAQGLGTDFGHRANALSLVPPLVTDSSLRECFSCFTQQSTFLC